MTITIIVVAAAVVTIAIGVSGCVRWIYRRGQQSGIAQTMLETERSAHAAALAEAQAEVKALKARVAEIQSELESMRGRRPRALLLSWPPPMRINLYAFR
jgi:hypothetical protein